MRTAAGMIGSVGKDILEKSSVEEIRDRFDRDVERFSNLETGQTATVDAALALDLVARSAAATTPAARAMLDIGCGAGNFTLKVLERLPNLDCTLIDLSPNMLARAKCRVSTATAGLVSTIQLDIRLVELLPNSVDVVVAAAVLHHLRDENEWRETFRKSFTGCAQADHFGSLISCRMNSRQFRTSCGTAMATILSRLKASRTAIKSSPMWIVKTPPALALPVRTTA